MVTNMIDRQAENRRTAEEYLKEQMGKAFPSCFYSFLLPYVQKILKEFSPDFVIYKYESAFICFPPDLFHSSINRLHRDFSHIMENLLMNHNNTNETPTIADDARKQEASECLLILLSLALSCMRKLKVRILAILS